MTNLKLLLATVAAAYETADLANLSHADQIVHLWSDEQLAEIPRSKVEAAFLKVFDDLSEQFPHDQYSSFLQQMSKDMQRYTSSNAYNGYRTVPGQPQCDAGAAFSPPNVKGMAAFPGGIVRRSLGFDLSKLVFDLAQKAEGPAGASMAMLAPLAMAALSQGAGTIQALVHTAVSIIPPMISPPVWNNQPLPCMPMVTGHNCFGAVLYPITAADFVMGDVSDAALDGDIANFPSLYKRKVGKTSDTQYHACFSQYMSMKCANKFPRCAVPQARQEPGPMGKFGMCFTHCIATLVACPGFWMDDINEECTNAPSVPPMCAFALFTNVWRAPPQYVSYEESQPAIMECPKADARFEPEAAAEEEAAGEGETAAIP